MQNANLIQFPAKNPPVDELLEEYRLLKKTYGGRSLQCLRGDGTIYRVPFEKMTAEDVACRRAYAQMQVAKGEALQRDFDEIVDAHQKALEAGDAAGTEKLNSRFQGILADLEAYDRSCRDLRT